MPPVFFISYAREDAENNPHLVEFVDLLVKAVAVKLAQPARSTAFYDGVQLTTGTDYQTTLPTALQECRVFVPLYSATYFKKEGCGKEWAVFRARQDEYMRMNEVDRPEVVIPVLWGARQDVLIPPGLEAIQFRENALPADYAELGMGVLFNQTLRRPIAEEAIEIISRRISDAASQLPAIPALVPRPDWKGIRPLFPLSIENVATPIAPPVGEGGPRFVQIVVVAGAKEELQTGPFIRTENRNFGPRLCDDYGIDRFDWRPYRPEDERRAGVLAAEVASTKDFYPEPVFGPLDDTLLRQLETAQDQNKIVVLLVDTWTLTIERYFRLMNRVNEKNFYNTAVLVLWDSDAETVEVANDLTDVVSNSFVFWSRFPDRQFVSPVKTASEFRRELADALVAARRRMHERAKILRPVSNGVPRPAMR